MEGRKKKKKEGEQEKRGEEGKALLCDVEERSFEIQLAGSWLSLPLPHQESVVFPFCLFAFVLLPFERAATNFVCVCGLGERKFFFSFVDGLLSGGNKLRFLFSSNPVPSFFFSLSPRQRSFFFLEREKSTKKEKV